MQGLKLADGQTNMNNGQTPMLREMNQALRACAITFVVCAVVYPAIVWMLPSCYSPRSKWQPDLRRRRTARDRLGAGRAAIRIRTLLSPAPIGGRVQGRRGRRLESGHQESRSSRQSRSGRVTQGDAQHPAAVDLVTASGSGLDPDISPEGAYFQAVRVAMARGLTLEKLHAVIERHINRSGAILGAPPRVNVLQLNLALDEGE